MNDQTSRGRKSQLSFAPLILSLSHALAVFKLFLAFILRQLEATQAVQKFVVLRFSGLTGNDSMQQVEKLPEDHTDL